MQDEWWINKVLRCSPPIGLCSGYFQIRCAKVIVGEIPWYHYGNCRWMLKSLETAFLSRVSWFYSSNCSRQSSTTMLSVSIMATWLLNWLRFLHILQTYLLCSRRLLTQYLRWMNLNSFIRSSSWPRRLPFTFYIARLITTGPSSIVSSLPMYK